MKNAWTALLATAVLASGSAAWAADAAKGSADAAFVTEAAKGGMAEVRLGQLAKSHAKSERVKAFGAQMVTDHGKANQELTALAAKKKITLPKDVGPENQRTETDLAKLKGEAFDKAYMAAMVKDHEKDVADFAHEAASGKDPEVKAWAAKTLPVLRAHLKMAKADAAMEHAPAHEKSKH
jgi:putative membrane protein